MEAVTTIHPHQLAAIVKAKTDKALIVDCRTFCEFNTGHVTSAVNVWSSKLRKKRLQQNAASITDYLQQACGCLGNFEVPRQVIVYDQSSKHPHNIPQDSFLYVFLSKLTKFVKEVGLVAGGYLVFHSLHPSLCESPSPKTPLTSLSQPCLPAVIRGGPSKVLPFLFLGSQHDANNLEVLREHNITHELNVSTSCPKPDFLSESNFMRIPVNDNFTEKLLPFFLEAFKFIDKAREAGQRILVHCLAGISRSPTVSIAFVMKHLHLHYDEAYRYVKSCRPSISPNINFVGQLLELDRQLNGDKILYRSPTVPIFLDHDFSRYDLSPSQESYVLKSCSVSCMESAKENFPFTLKRSLPSLKLKSMLECDDSAEESSPVDVDLADKRFSLHSPRNLTPVDSLSWVSAIKGGVSSTSDRLPSSPLTISSPTSPSFEDIYNHLCDIDKDNTLSNVEEVVESPEICFSNAKTTSGSATFEHKNGVDVSEIGEIASEQVSRTSECKDNFSLSSECISQLCGKSIDSEISCGRFSTIASISIDSSSRLREDETLDSRSPVIPLSSTKTENGNSPFTYVHIEGRGTAPMVVRETPLLVTQDSSLDAQDSSLDAQDQEESAQKNSDSVGSTSDCSSVETIVPICKPPPKPRLREIVIPITMTSSGDEKSPESEGSGQSNVERSVRIEKEADKRPAITIELPAHEGVSKVKSPNSVGTAVSPGMPPIPPSTSPTAVVLRNPLKRTEAKMNTKPLPRCYSSSETHLNTRRLLENNAAATNSGEQSCARKSFSSDEVGRAWMLQQQLQHSPSNPPLTTSSSSSTTTSGHSSHSPMMVLNFSSDLARCDSWSTSGLGSEISDFESLQEDAHSMATEDTQGPYDAVFSDVFPGDGADGVKTCSSLPIKDMKDLRDMRNPPPRGRLLRQQKTQSVDSDRLCIFGSTGGKPLSTDLVRDLKECFGTSPTPRPVSLPGVTKMYDAKNTPQLSSSLDMGVGLEESPDWQTEDENFSFGGDGESKSSLTEHPPADAKTMGENVRHTMTWYKIETWPTPALPLDSSPSKISSISSAESLQNEAEGMDSSSEKQVLPTKPSPLTSSVLNTKPQEKYLLQRQDASEMEDGGGSLTTECVEAVDKLDNMEVSLRNNDSGGNLKDGCEKISFINYGDKLGFFDKSVMNVNSCENSKLSHDLPEVKKDVNNRNGKVFLIDEHFEEAKDGFQNRGCLSSDGKHHTSDFLDATSAEDIKNGNDKRTFYDMDNVKREIDNTVGSRRYILNIDKVAEDSAYNIESLMTGQASSPKSFILPETCELPLAKTADNIDQKLGECSTQVSVIKNKLDELENLEERWKWWENEFKKKMQNIRNNAKLSSWEDVKETKETISENALAGFHLTQELMQSMEDLLESEISDIKKQAKSLSNRFSLLAVKTSDDQSVEDNAPQLQKSSSGSEKLPKIMKDDRNVSSVDAQDCSRNVFSKSMESLELKRSQGRGVSFEESAFDERELGGAKRTFNDSFKCDSVKPVSLKAPKLGWSLNSDGAVKDFGCERSMSQAGRPVLRKLTMPSFQSMEGNTNSWAPSSYFKQNSVKFQFDPLLGSKLSTSYTSTPTLVHQPFVPEFPRVSSQTRPHSARPYVSPWESHLFPTGEGECKRDKWNVSDVSSMSLTREGDRTTICDNVRKFESHSAGGRCLPYADEQGTNSLHVYKATEKVATKDVQFDTSSKCRDRETARKGNESNLHRSKSEPPPLSDEGLYRVRSCPGIVDKNLPAKPGVKFRQRDCSALSTSAVSSQGGDIYANRYSCGALDFVLASLNPTTSSTFESCPNVTEENNSRPTFKRLLSVS